MIRPVVCAFIAMLAGSAARANDTMAELGAGGLVHTRSDTVEMAEEHLSISEQEVVVDYVFRNKSAEEVKALVAFPLPDILGSADLMVAIPEWESDNFLGFSVMQDGVAIVPNLDQRAFALNIDVTDDLKSAGIPLVPFGEKTAAAIKALADEKTVDFVRRGILLPQEWDEGQGMQTHYVPVWTLRSTYWWNTVFPASAEIKVHHRYKTAPGGTTGVSFLDENGKPAGERWAEYQTKYCADESFAAAVAKGSRTDSSGMEYSAFTESWIRYVLTTGANWSGPIGKFTLTVDKGAPENLVSFCGTGVIKTGPTTFEMKAQDYWPERDLDILILKRAKAE